MTQLPLIYDVFFTQNRVILGIPRAQEPRMHRTEIYPSFSDSPFERLKKFLKTIPFSDGFSTSCTSWGWLVVYPIIYKVLAPSKRWLFQDFWTINRTKTDGRDTATGHAGALSPRPAASNVLHSKGCPVHCETCSHLGQCRKCKAIHLFPGEKNTFTGGGWVSQIFFLVWFQPLLPATKWSYLTIWIVFKGVGSTTN